VAELGIGRAVKRNTVIAVLGAVISACSNSSSLPQSSPASQGAPQASLANAIGQETLYVSDIGALVNVYDQHGNLKGNLVDGIDTPVNGLATDPTSSTLYALSSFVAVTAFAPGTVVPAGAYGVNGYALFGDALTVDQNYVYVILTGCTVVDSGCTHPLPDQQGEVLIYRRSATPSLTARPVRTLLTPPNNFALAATVDNKGTLYVEYGGYPTAAHIEAFEPGSSKHRTLPMELGLGGGSLALDARGDLIACDQIARAIEIFKPNASKPSRMINDGLSNCSYFALSKDERTLFASNEAVLGGQLQPGASISIYDYASGKRLRTSSQGLSPTTSFLGALAVSPAAPLGNPY
jgi:hypothetical protein